MDDTDQQQEVDVHVGLVDILDYVGDSVRPIREGLAVLEAQHIVCLGYTRKSAAGFEAKGFVLQSSHPGERPHEINLKIQDDNTLWDLTCSCKAGTRRCKHIIACLLQISQFKSLEYLSCTDATQAWGHSKKEKTSLWGARLVQDMCCVRRPKPLVSQDDTFRVNLLADAFAKLVAAAPDSSISKHIAGRHYNPVEFRSEISAAAVLPMRVHCSSEDLQQLLFSGDNITARCQIDNSALNPVDQDFYEKFVCVTQHDVLKIAVDTEAQNTKEWQLQRSIRITASSCYSLYTYSKNENPDWERKIQQYLKPKTFLTKEMRYGKQAEEKAFLCYSQKRNPFIKKTGFIIHYEEPWIGGSPDGIDTLSGLILEIKCPFSGKDNSIEWIVNNCSATKRYLKAYQLHGETRYMLNKKHSYYAQVQVNMWVMKCVKSDFVVYSSKDDDFIVVEVDYDEEFITELKEALKLVYVKYVLPKLNR